MNKFLKYFLIWVGFWIILGIIVLFTIGKGNLEILIGIVLAAVISLILMLKVLNEAWEGTVIERKTERVASGTSKNRYYSNVDFVYVKLTNGKTKKVRAMPQWQVGTRLVKHRGEMQTKIFNSK